MKNMKKLFLLSLSSLLLLTSCSLFDSWKNGEGTFKDDLIYLSFEKEPELQTVIKAENTFTVNGTTYTKDFSKASQITIAREESKLEVRYQDVEGNASSLETYIYKYLKTKNEDETYSYTINTYKGSTCLETKDTTREEFDTKYNLVDTYYSNVKDLYFNNFLTDFNSYKENKDNSSNITSYTFRYFQQSGIWYIQMKVFENSNEVKRYTLSYSSFEKMNDKNKTITYYYLGYFVYGTFYSENNINYYTNTSYSFTTY